MGRLELDISVALRSFTLALELNIGQETLALVGPSGAGKTTVLRAVAGLISPDAGRIALDDRRWFDSAAGIDLPPEARAVGLVFQEYALFPHMSVRANVAYGGGRRTDDLLERFHIGHLAGEKPGALSGGERQRVALARALARDPAVLLLDEPLSALDAHTRAVVRTEMQDLLAELGLPTLFITHDFRDAAALADRVGVIVDGRLRQLDDVDVIGHRPADAFVATLTGGNLLPGRADGSEVALDLGVTVRSSERASGRVGVAVYPWEVGVANAPADGLNAIPGTVGDITDEGGRVRVRVGEVVCECSHADVERLSLRRGALAHAVFEPSAARLVTLDD
jgi:ABC-type sulfate/molybdate transport systems ATPase subunit